jgi:hypothetical protein
MTLAKPMQQKIAYIRKEVFKEICVFSIMKAPVQAGRL